MQQPSPPASALTRALALVLLAAVFLRAGAVPVANLDSWSDWKSGQWIWEQRRLPDHDIFSPYSDPQWKGHDSAWLAEVTYYLVGAKAGLEGVALLHALLETAKAGFFLLAVRRLTGSLGTAAVATALMEAAVEWCAAWGCTEMDALALPGDRTTKQRLEAAGFTARLLTLSRRLD